MMMRKIFTALALIASFTGSALAQSNPGLRQGQVPTPAQWNSYFSAKQDALGYTPLSTAGGTISGNLVVTGNLTVGSISFNSITMSGLFSSTNTTDIAIPSPAIGYAGAIKTLGGITAAKGIQGQGGYLYLGTGANNGGLLGSGAVVIGMIGGDAGSVGCGGAAIDFDNGVSQTQTQTIGNASLVNNCLLAGMTTYLSTPTWKSNEGRFFYYSGNPATHGATTSLIGSLDYAQGFRVNLNTTLVFASLTAPLTGTSLQLTQANSTINRIQMDSYGASNFISGARSNGTKASPTALVLNDEIIGINAYGYGTSVQGPAGHAGIYAAGTWSGPSTPTYVDLCTTPSGSTSCTSRMRVESDGGITTGGAASQGSGTLNLLGSLYNNGTAPTGSAGGYVRATSPTISALTVTGSFTATGLVTNADLTNSTISGVSLGGTLGTLTFGTHLASGGASYNGSAGVTITSDATAVNTASTIMARDGSGQVAATTFTGALAGNASTASAVPASGLTGTTLASGVTITSITSLGTITSLNATAIGAGTPGTAAFTTLTASGVMTITNATNITLPAPYLFNTGALQVTGGASIQGDVQIKGGSSAEAFLGIGDGTRTLVDVNLNSAASGTGCGGVVDFDAAGTQYQALGSWSSMHNSACDLTPTWRANQGVWKFNNGSSTDVSFQISGSSSTNTGINITPAAAASGVDIAAISTGSNENLTINAKGTGAITLGNASTGTVTATPALAVTNGIVGVTNGSDAAAGRVGQTFYTLAGNDTITFTVTIASPAVVTQVAHRYSNTGTAAFVATTTGALPTGLVAGTVYWVIPGTVSGNTFQVATSIANAFAGTAVNTSGSQSGTHTGKSSVPLTTATSVTVAAIQLTAGDWDVYSNGLHDVQNTTTVTQEITNASLTVGGDFLNLGQLTVNFPSTGSQNNVSVTPFRVSTNSTQIVYLQAFDQFAVSTARFAGYMTARRVR